MEKNNWDEIRDFMLAIPIRRTIAILLTCLFIFLAIKGKMDPGHVSSIYGVIIGFYFGKESTYSEVDHREEYQPDCPPPHEPGAFRPSENKPTINYEERIEYNANNDEY